MLSAVERTVLRNVLDGTPMRGVDELTKPDHDAAVISLLERGLLRYVPSRPRQKFNVTADGLFELQAAERHATLTLRGLAKEWSR